MNSEEQKSISTRTGLEIAVIGMSGRFPGAKNIAEFRENLENGVESISFFSRRELEEDGVTPRELEDPDYVKANGILEGVSEFDAAFFGYTPGEAAVMDPQVRIYHECVWEALENAGYGPGAYGGVIGMYAGAAPHFNWEALMYLSGKIREVGPFAALNLMNKDFMATRVSYSLNLRGPSFSVQTACSTSLVAIHLASQGLLSGESHIAVAGGVSVALLSKSGYAYREGMINSPDGHCRAFDALAGGIVSGDGAGVVVLKPLEEAEADRDYIWAVIKGSAINNDGSAKVGYSAPAVQGQVEVLQAALRAADVEPGSIGYIETHGTGTPLGDPIEVEALTRVYATGEKHYCRLGSVKTNIGHLNSAAGVAGFIKAVLALKFRCIPPSLHYRTPNPKIDFENSPFQVNRQLTPWNPGEHPLRAGVSSFGIGGTNAHIILEEWPEPVIGHSSLVIGENKEGRENRLIVLSAKTETALEKMTQNLAAYFQKDPGINLADAAYTLQVGRDVFKHRKMLVCTSLEEAARELSLPVSPEVSTYYDREESHAVVFMFSGQGSQYVRMGWDLYQREPVFRQEIDRCFEILKGLLEYDIKEVLYPGSDLSDQSDQSDRSDLSDFSDSSDIDRTEIAQPVLFCFEYALARLLNHWGIEPYAMIGHSVGEYVAASQAGVFSIEDALRLVVWRGQLMQGQPAGAMISVPLPTEELGPMLQSNPALSLAAVNSTSLCVVSGPMEAIGAFEKSLGEKSIKTTRLHTSHAFHSGMMDPILAEFEAEVKKIPLKEPGLPYISNVTGKWITENEATDPRYWADHIRQTVRYSEGMAELFKEQGLVFVEIGPGNALATFARNHKDREPGQMTMNLVRHPKDKTTDDAFLLNQLGRLWLYGIRPNWPAYYGEEKPRRQPLPAYPFERRTYPVKGNIFAMAAGVANTKVFSTKRKEIADWYYVPSWKRSPQAVHTRRPRDRESVPENLDPGWLVFCPGSGLGVRLVSLLEREQPGVVVVGKGTVFTRDSENRYTIDPQQPDHYRSLLAALHEAKGKIPGIILHLWGVNEETGAGGQEQEFERAFERALENGFFSLLNLVQAMTGETQPTADNPVRMEVVTSYMQAVAGEKELHPGKATVLGLVKVIPQENPGIRCRSIDIDIPPPESPQEEKLLRQLQAECLIPAKDAAKVIAYRDNQRWEQEFQAIPLEETGDPTGNEPGIQAAAAPIPLREKGVYLITGGQGGIGLLIARDLARCCQARMVLTGRTQLPPPNQWEDWLNNREPGDSQTQKIRKLKELEQSGAEVLAIKADAANLEEMQAAITRAEQRYGTINGVIHAAGITRGESFSPVAQLTPGHCREQFRSKIHGLVVLDELFQGKELDFFISMSSLSSVLGGLRFAAYAAANCYMDAYATKRSRTSPNRWVSIDWDGWNLEENRETQPGTPGTRIEGQAETRPDPRPGTQDAAAGKKSTSPDIRPAEGIEAFTRILRWGEAPQVIVSTRDLQTRIRQWIQLETRPREKKSRAGDEEKPALLARPPISTSFCPPRTQLEETIANIWQNFFGFPVGIYDDFFEMGGDSLKALTIIDKMNRQMNARLSTVEMFSNSTIENLAECIANGKGDYEEAPYIPLNPNKSKKVFAWPPVLGDGIIYKDLTFPLKEYSFYAFNYIDGPDKIRRYLEMMQEIQPQGPYVLMGYSSGGSLAFEIAKALEAQGYETGDIILWDTYRMKGFAEPTAEERQEFQNQILDVLNQYRIRSETYKQKLLEKADKYYVYISSIENRGAVNANLHLIVGTDRKPEDLKEWEKATLKKHIAYQGYEAHNQLLDPTIRVKNTALLKQILDSLEWK